MRWLQRKGGRAKRVRDLLHHQQRADSEAVVVYPQRYADVSEADEVQHGNVASELWTWERHHSTDGQVGEIYHPAASGPSLGWDPKTDEQWPERGVTLSPAHGTSNG